MHKPNNRLKFKPGLVLVVLSTSRVSTSRTPIAEDQQSPFLNFQKIEQNVYHNLCQLISIIYFLPFVNKTEFYGIEIV